MIKSTTYESNEKRQQKTYTMIVKNVLCPFSKAAFQYIWLFDESKHPLLITHYHNVTYYSAGRQLLPC